MYTQLPSKLLLKLYQVYLSQTQKESCKETSVTEFYANRFLNIP